MWKEYSKSYLQNNRTAGLSVRIAAFISALLLSLMCGIFYNLWKYEVERIVLEEGSWQSRIAGEFTSEQIDTVRNYASVKEVAVTKQGSEGSSGSGENQGMDSRGGETVIDICFDRYSSVLKDTPRIAEAIGASPENVAYHYGLLAMYLIRHPSDPSPRLLFPLFLVITALASLSLIVIIHNSFALTMNARIHQFGIFSSIGATPKQIRTCLLQEAGGLCVLPVLAGNLLGVAGSMGVMEMTNILLGSDVPGRHRAVFGCHPLVLGATLSVTILTVWISAWLPAGKLSRLSPLEAIKNTGEPQLKRRKNSPFLALVFGVEGELAGNALKAQRKALRTASLSLVFSFLAFTMMECFVTTSYISTQETYFVILDDSSFLEYCAQIGISPGLDGAVVRNLIRDVADPDFRHVRDLPYLNADAAGTVSILRSQDNEEATAEVPVLGYTAEVPLLREEYAKLDYYQLVHFLPVSLWKEIRAQIGNGEEELYIRVLGEENATLTQLNALQEQIGQALGGKYAVESENRIQEYETNERQIQGMSVIFGGFCALLALIGIGNVFSNTLGFVRQRKREFARYMSLGLAPENIGKMFRIEALVLAGRPVLITLPLAVLTVGLMLKMSYIGAGEFFAQAPLVPIGGFLLAIVGFVFLAYYLGWRGVRKISLAQVLRDDTML